MISNIVNVLAGEGKKSMEEKPQWVKDLITR